MYKSEHLIWIAKVRVLDKGLHRPNLRAVPECALKASSPVLYFPDICLWPSVYYSTKWRELLVRASREKKYGLNVIKSTAVHMVQAIPESRELLTQFTHREPSHLFRMWIFAYGGHFEFLPRARAALRGLEVAWSLFGAIKNDKGWNWNDSVPNFALVQGETYDSQSGVSSLVTSLGL